VAAVAAVCRIGKDYAINKEKQKWLCIVLDTSQFSMIKYIHDEGNLSETE
jgi:hypothetical protein